MEPKIFWVRKSGQGPRTFTVRVALILMGDWCGENVTDTMPKK
jgi:hypothetical protein